MGLLCVKGHLEALTDVEGQILRELVPYLRPFMTRILLALALTRTRDPKEIQRMFATY